MKNLKECMPAGFKLEYIKGHGNVIAKHYPKYCIVVEEVNYDRFTGYRVVLLKSSGNNEYTEISCLPEWGERIYRIISKEDVEKKVAELLDINGFSYWINDVLNSN